METARPGAVVVSGVKMDAIGRGQEWLWFEPAWYEGQRAGSATEVGLAWMGIEPENPRAGRQCCSVKSRRAQR